MADSRAIERDHRRLQFTLRTLLLLAIPTALLAIFLKVWFPQLNPGPENVGPSAFYSPLDSNQLEALFRRTLPKGASFHTTRHRTSGSEISPKKGKWTRTWNGSLVCYPAEADRAMETFRSDLQQAVRQHGGEIREEQECLDGSSLMGVRFIYMAGEHSGALEVTYGPARPFGAFPEVDPPFRQLFMRIEESIGFERDLETHVWESENSSSATPTTAVWKTIEE